MNTYRIDYTVVSGDKGFTFITAESETEALLTLQKIAYRKDKLAMTGIRQQNHIQ